jgi:hypothetical protein
MVLLHDDDVIIVTDSVIIHGCDPFVESKILKACNLSEDVVKDTSFVDAFGEVHFLYRYLLGLVNVCLTAVDHAVCPGIYLFPVFIVAKIRELICQQFEQALARKTRLYSGDQISDKGNDAFVGLIVEMVMKNV